MMFRRRDALIGSAVLGIGVAACLGLRSILDSPRRLSDKDSEVQLSLAQAAWKDVYNNVANPDAEYKTDAEILDLLNRYKALRSERDARQAK